MEHSQSSQPLDPRILRISPEDNVGSAATTLQAGESVMIDGESIVLAECVPTGHKLALVPIAAGEQVVKFGLPIGSATVDIRTGDYVHTHNVKSDYLPTYTLDGTNPFLKDAEGPVRDAQPGS